jgi:hypothetical protein
VAIQHRWRAQNRADGARLELLAIKRVKLRIDRALNAKRRRDKER